MTTDTVERPDRVTVAFQAETAADAVAMAKAWAADEPLRIKTVCSVRRQGAYGRWAVELAVRWLA